MITQLYLWIQLESTGDWQNFLWVHAERSCCQYDIFKNKLWCVSERTTIASYYIFVSIFDVMLTCTVRICSVLILSLWLHALLFPCSNLEVTFAIYFLHLLITPLFSSFHAWNLGESKLSWRQACVKACIKDSMKISNVDSLILFWSDSPMWLLSDFSSPLED